MLLFHLIIYEERYKHELIPVEVFHREEVDDLCNLDRRRESLHLQTTWWSQPGTRAPPPCSELPLIHLGLTQLHIQNDCEIKVAPPVAGLLEDGPVPFNITHGASLPTSNA
jgi:hypothetical protein